MSCSNFFQVSFHRLYHDKGLPLQESITEEDVSIEIKQERVQDMNWKTIPENQDNSDDTIEEIAL